MWGIDWRGQGAITLTCNDVYNRLKGSHQKHLVTWAGSILGNGVWQNNATCVDGYTSAVFSWETTTTPLCFSALENRDSLPACDQTVTGLHRTSHYQHSHLSSFSPLRFPYLLLAFGGDFQLFGSSQENSHKSAKVPRSGIVFNLEKKTGGENLSTALQELNNLIIWH